MTTGYLVLFVLLAVTLAYQLVVAKKLTSQASSKSITYLAPVYLIEEFNYTDKVLVDFNNPTTLANVNVKSRIKLKILSATSSSTSSTNNKAAVLVGDSPLISKFAISDGYTLYTSSRFDREELLASGQCDKPVKGVDVNETDVAVSDCMFKLKVALYDDHNNLISFFIVPVFIEDINDNTPSFKSSTIRVGVSENLVSQFVTPLESPIDRDSDKYSVQNCTLLYNVNTIKYKSLFDVKYDRANHNLNLIVSSPLDFESTSEYKLELSCFDGHNEAVIDLIVNVIDANDNMPFFKRDVYRLTVEEDKLIENLVEIEADDLDDPNGPNGQLLFTLPCELNTQDACQNLFFINESTGVLGLKKPLDYEKTKSYLLKVKVQDRGSANSVSIYANVYIDVQDVNDNAPVGTLSFEDNYLEDQNLQNQTIWVKEDLYRSEVVVALCYISISDADTQPINGFNLAAEIIDISFMNSTTQRITHLVEHQSSPFKLVPIITDYNNIYYMLQLQSALDREKASYYDIRIKLFDNGTFHRQLSSFMSVRIILIDVNDNAPVFVNTNAAYKVEKQLEEPTTSSRLESFNYYKFFVKENQPKLNFAHMKAIDIDQPNTRNAKIEYRILDENEPSLVSKYLKLNKTNDMSQISGVSVINPNFLFYVNPENGSLSVRGELDREQRDLYLFTVRAQDNTQASNKTGDVSLYSDILVEINILDENDNQPTYANTFAQFSVKENEPINKLVGNVKAQDPDLDPRIEYTFEPALMHQFFHVDSVTGDLLTSRTFDAEDLSLRSYLTNDTTFNFRIHARDVEFKTPLSSVTNEGSPSSSILNVNIFLTDLNDNVPQLVDLDPQLSESFIQVDLKDSNETNLIVKRMKSIDLDRDCTLTTGRKDTPEPHTFKISFIRRFSWQFLYEISRNEPTLEQEIADYIKRMVDANPAQTTSNRSLKSVFSLTADKDLSDPIDVCSRSVDIVLNSPSDSINSGIYNLSVILLDSDLKTDKTLKLLVFNSTTNQTGLNLTQLDSLNRFLENWWLENYNLIVGFNAKNNKSMDDLDSLFTQDYYKFYASAFSRRFNSFNSDYNGSFSMDLVPHLLNFLLFKNTSNFIIFCMSVFALISVFLISMLVYKQSQASSAHRRKSLSSGSSTTTTSMSNSAAGQKKSAMFINLNTSSHSSSNAHHSGDSSTGSTYNMSDNSLSSVSEKKYDSRIMMLMINEANNNPQQKIIATSSPNCNNQSSSTTKQSMKRISICEPYTDTVDVSSHKKPSANQQLFAASSVSSASSDLVIHNSNKFLSTFSPVVQVKATLVNTSSSSSEEDGSKASSSPPASIIQNNKDTGYYGSSDYSDHHNVTGSSGFTISYNQRKVQPQQTVKVINLKAPVGTNNSTVSFATNTSSSLLSSPSTSSDSTTASIKNHHHYHHPPTTITTTTNPIITTLYPNVYSTNPLATGKIRNNSDVKIYFERFERIYNANDPNLAETELINDESTESSKRNSISNTYSYV